ncbi:MAG: DUF6519 domain-containing protein [Chromatiales bacterium]
MKGDFSKLHFDPHEHARGVALPEQGVLRNISGVLHQQGRVMSDADLTEGELLELGWEGQAGRDIIGAGVCAVPSSDPDAFRIDSAFVNGTEVRVTVRPGHVWADGILTRLAGLNQLADGSPTDPKAAVVRRATYFGPPIADSQPSSTDIGDGVRDAVILEVSEEALHGFQYPERLIEPALGGPDTAERAFVNFRFRLLRLDDGEDCNTIVGHLHDDPTTKDPLSVTLAPVVALDKDCPVVGGGGYTGFEHHLYRIEIADTAPGASARFKWSQWNGGLVGRGRFFAATTAPARPARVTIDAGRAAIVNSGLTKFYLEALQYDDLAGTWNVVYGTTVTLNADHDLELTTPQTFGNPPTTTTANQSVFFRLWNDLREIADFTNAVNPVELRDGIHLEFVAAGNYRPGDYWTFTVRAGEIPNPAVLIDRARPTGIVYHRVPLAEIHWSAPLNTTISSTIEDCRYPFHPLSRLTNCCTRRVGDGIESHGEFDKIQDAINSLPEREGGQICVLPGKYTENVLIKDRSNVILSGCGKRSRLVSSQPQGEFVQADPVIHIVNSTGVRIESLAIEAHDTGYGILAKVQAGDPDSPTPLPLQDLTMVKLSVRAATRSAIEVRNAQFVTIEHCDIEMRDVAGSWPGVFVTADDVLIERNTIRVSSRSQASELRAFALPVGVGLGGLQIGGTSEHVRIINNLIQGGRGNGITLGSVIVVNGDDQDTGIIIAWPIDPCQPCLPGDSRFPDPEDGDDRERGTRTRSAGPLYDIHIERNRILDMGMNGIGVAAFFNLDRVDEFITVEHLTIVANCIRDCLRRQLARIDEAMINSMGYGGIQLADVSYLLIRENLIGDNGPSHLEPVCGVFVLHGEGIEIAANRILNNGAKTTALATGANGGRRSGIHIVYAIAPRVATDFGRFSVPMQNGIPALEVHDNIVSQPLGQALAAAALGPVSVQGNQLTSRGVVLRSEPNLPTFVGATVLIFNLGLSNETYWQLLAFAAVRNGQISTTIAPSTSNDEVVIVQPGLDDVRIGQYIANGNVLFCDNQCVLDLLERGTGLALASVTILSLDDIGFHNNQCDGNLLDDFMISQAFLFGISLRVSDNRFKEGIFNAIYSAITLGVLNTTTDNQSTHCLLIRGWPGLTVDQPNTVTLAGVNPAFCGRFAQLITNFGRNRVITNG